MLQKPLLFGLCVVVWVFVCEVFLSVAETIVGGLCVVEWVLFCEAFLGVAETIVVWPV